MEPDYLGSEPGSLFSSSVTLSKLVSLFEAVPLGVAGGI